MGGRPASRANVWLRRLALTGAALLFAAIAAELILPWFPPHLGQFRRIVYHPGDGSARYALRPNSEVAFSGVFERIRPSVTWQVNGERMRADAPVTGLSSRYRIATYGDSETFGWSVDLADTFQRRMQAIDPRVEVLNFGVPGYNVEDVLGRIETTLGRYEPDMLVYLVNKNDVDEALDISDPVLASELLLRLRFAYQMWKRPWRTQSRNDLARYSAFADTLDQIAVRARAARTPLLLVFMKARTLQRARASAAPGGATAGLVEGGEGDLRVVVVEDLLDTFRRADDHLSTEANAALAERICGEITGVGPPGCIPDGWSREGLPAAASLSPQDAAATSSAAARASGESESRHRSSNDGESSSSAPDRSPRSTANLAELTTARSSSDRAP